MTDPTDLQRIIGRLDERIRIMRKYDEPCGWMLRDDIEAIRELLSAPLRVNLGTLPDMTPEFMKKHNIISVDAHGSLTRGGVRIGNDVTTLGNDDKPERVMPLRNLPDGEGDWQLNGRDNGEHVGDDDED